MNTDNRGNKPFTIFYYKNIGKVRVSIDKEDNPWFCLSDVCSILGIDEDTDVRSMIDEDGFDLVEVISKGEKQKMIFVDEGNLFKLVGRLRNSESQPFIDWICWELMPKAKKNRYSSSKLMTEMEMIHKISGTIIDMESRLSSIEDGLDEQARINDYVKMDLTLHEDDIDRIESRLSALEDILLGQWFKY